MLGLGWWMVYKGLRLRLRGYRARCRVCGPRETPISDINIPPGGLGFSLSIAWFMELWHD